MEIKRCQFCYEEIADEAIVCKHCRNWQFDENEMKTLSLKRARSRAFSFVSVMLIFWLFIVYIISVSLLQNTNQITAHIGRILVFVSLGATIPLGLWYYFKTKKRLSRLVDASSADFLVVERRFQKAYENTRLMFGLSLLSFGILALSKYSDQFIQFAFAGAEDVAFLGIVFLVYYGLYLTVSGIIRELKEKN